MTRGLVGAALAGGLVLGCAESDDPMDRDAVAELARTQGDAQGGARTGTWGVRLVEQTCTCPSDITAYFSICQADEALGFIPLTMRVVEGDGVITLVPESGTSPNFDLGGELSGPIDADGTFGAGIVTIGIDVAAELVVTARLEAEMDGTEAFAGDLRVRLRGKAGERTVSCESLHELQADRLF